MTALAHPDLETQLSILERRVEDGCNEAVELQRGRLLRLRRDWAGALAAYNRAAACSPLSVEPDVARAQLHLDAARPASGLVYIDRALQRFPRNPEALLVRGRIERALGRFGPAADAFEAALAILLQPQPEHFLDRARAQLAAGRSEAAERGLEEALGRLGPVSALVRLRIELQRERGDLDGALHTLDLTSRLPNQEVWLLQRAEILELAKRTEEALTTYEATLQAIALRPWQRRQTQAFQLLETRALAGRQRLATANESRRNTL